MIDFHVHAGDFFRLRDDIQGLLTRRPLEEGEDITRLFTEPAELERYLRRHGVQRAVMLAECGPGTNFSIDSEMIAGKARGSDFFIPFGNINPNFHDARKELEKSLALGVRGFKFYPADHSFDPYTRNMWDVYGECERNGLPIIFHTGHTSQRDAEQKNIQPSDFERIARGFPRLTIILAHAGKPLWYQEARELILRHENLYADTALVPLTELTTVLGDLRDIRHKVVFGSDWPVVGSYSQLMSQLEQAHLPPDIASDILHGNANGILSRAGRA